jgi:hypothetical protein
MGLRLEDEKEVELQFPGMQDEGSAQFFTDTKISFPAPR